MSHITTLQILGTIDVSSQFGTYTASDPLLPVSEKLICQNLWRSYFVYTLAGPDTRKGAAQNRQFSKEFPDLLVTKYRFHFIFYLTENLPKPVITRIIHERKDIVNRLSDRLT